MFPGLDMMLAMMLAMMAGYPLGPHAGLSDTSQVLFLDPDNRLAA